MKSKRVMVRARWAVVFVAAGAAASIGACRQPVVCAANEDFDPMSGVCLRLCTDEVAPGIPCRSDGGTFEAGPRRDAASDGSGDHVVVDAGRCATGEERCGADCVALATSVVHCGRCGSACTAPSNGDPMCSGGTCDFVCRRGFERVAGGCEVPQARLIAPMSASWVSSNRPTLHWAPRADVEGSLLEVCSARECGAGQVIATIDATGSSARVATALEPGSYFWRVRHKIGTTVASRASHTWGFFVGRGNAPRDTSWGGVLDFDGDGLADVAVSAPEWGDATRTNAGRFDVIVSNGSGMSFDGRLTRGTTGGGLLGARIANAGDVNGDGRSDLLVTESGSEVVVSLWLGTDRSGFSDLSRSLELRSPVAESGFGWASTGVGDVDRDGYGDVAVGAPYEQEGAAMRAGAVYIYFGGATGLSRPPLRLSGTRERGFFGAAIAAAGDTNADGFSDIVVGAPNQIFNSSSGPGDGEAFVFLGTLAGVDRMNVRRIAGAGVGSLFGSVVAGLGDCNGDGLSDVGIAAPLDSRSGYREGGSVAVVNGSQSVPLVVRTVFGDNDMIHLGTALAGGDVDGDGFDDVIASAPTSTLPSPSTVGEIHVFRGAADGVVMTPNRIRELVANPGNTLGAAVAFLGPFVRGGPNYLAIGAPGHNGGEGMAYRVRGGAFPIMIGGPGTSGTATIPGDRALGRAIAGSM